MNEPIAPAELNKSQKFVRILQELQNTPEGITTVDLMDRYNLDDRTLRRYLNDFEEIGIAIQKEGRGQERTLKLTAQFQRSNVQLSLLEWVSLHFGRQLFNFLEGTGFAQDMSDALDKMSSIAGTQNIQLTEKMFHAVPEHAKRHDRQGIVDVIDEVLTALLYKKQANCFYAKVGTKMKEYLLEPYSIVTYRQGLYLFARDVDVDIVKTFAIDRFHSFKRIKTSSFEVPEDYHPKSLLSTAFGIIGGQPHEIRLRFARTSAPYIQERIWHHSQTNRINSDGSVELTMNVSLSAELKQWILGFGPEVEVIAPQKLAEEIFETHFEACRKSRPDLFRGINIK